MRIDWQRALAAIALLGALPLLAACPGKLSDKAEFLAYAAAHPNGGDPPTLNEAGAPSTDACGDVVERIFVPTCGGTGCHSAIAPQQGLDLVSPGVAARVVGVTGKVCASNLADPQNPEASLIYEKLLAMPKCGAQMPLARPPLSSSDIACVLAWIQTQ